MSLLSTGLTFIGLSLVIYSLTLIWTPLAFMAGGILTLKVAWNLDGGEE
jgi:hypothetical protein